jgi:hypothetical protein
MEIEVTWARVIDVWWALLWRGLIALLAAAVAGGVAGFVVGFILGMLGTSIPAIRIVCGALGAVLGLLISLFPVKLILGRDFGDFRLALVPREASPESPVASREAGT